jgi:hypothetical protein
MNTIFKFLHSIMVTLTLQISKLTKAVVSNYGRSSIKIAHFIPIRWQTWSQTILVSDCPISNNLLLFSLAKWAELWWEAPIEGSVCIKFPRPIRNKNYLWRPCLLTDRDEMSNLYRRPSIVASYQVSVHLAKNF